MLKTREINQPEFAFVHKVNKGPECKFGVFDMIEHGTDDKIHALDVTDLGVVDSVLGEDLFEHLLESRVVGKREAFRVGTEEIFGNLGLLDWVDFL